MARIERKIHLVLEDKQYRDAHGRFMRAQREQIKGQQAVDRALAGASRDATKAAAAQERATRRSSAAYRQAGKDAEQYGRRATTVLKQVAAQTERTTERSNAMARAYGGIRTLMATFAVGAVVKGLFSISSSAEQTRIAFATMLGSAKEADAVLKDLYAFSGSTPFGGDEVVTAARSLLNAGVAAKDLKTELASIGSVAAGAQIPLDELAAIYAKMKNGQLVMTEDVNQLADRGIPIYRELAEVLGISTTQIKEFASKGKIGFDDLQQAFANMSAEGGVYDGILVKMSQSAQGLLDSLVDVSVMFARDVASSAFEALKGDIEAVSARVAELSADGTLKVWGQQLAGALRQVYETGRLVVGFLAEWGPWLTRAAVVVVALKTAQLGWNTAMVVGAFVQNGLRVASLAFAAVQALVTGNTLRAAAAMRLLNVAVSSNPIGLLVVGLTTAAALFLTFRDNTDSATAGLLRQQRVIADQQAAVARLEAAYTNMGEAAMLAARAQLVAQRARRGSERADLQRQRDEAQSRVDQNDPTGRTGAYNPTGLSGGAGMGLAARVLNAAAAPAGLQRFLVGGRLAGAVAGRGDTAALDARLSKLNDDALVDEARIHSLEGELQRRDRGPRAVATPTTGGTAGSSASGRDATSPGTSAADTREADRTAEQGRELREAVVEADRQREAADAEYQIEARMEALRQERQLADQITGAMDEGNERSVRAAEERFDFTARELGLQMDLLAVRTSNANGENDARRTAAVAEANRGPAENKDAAVAAATAEHEQRRTEIANRSALDRERIETESQANGLQLLTDGNERSARLQADHLDRLQAENDAYYGSDAELAARAGTVREQIDQGLIHSLRDVDEAQSALNEAYAAAETDAERQRVVRLQQELARLGAALERATQSFGERLSEALGEAAEIAAGLSGLLATAGVGSDGFGAGLSDAIGVAASGAQLGASIASGDVAGAVKAGIATAGNVVKMIKGFGDRAEEERRNRRALAAATEATERNTRAMLEEAVVGENYTREQLDGATDGLAGARSQVAGINRGTFGSSGLSEAQDAVSEYLQGLSGRGLDVSDLQQQLQAALNISGTRERQRALNAVLDQTESRFAQLVDHLGEYGASVEGALRQFTDSQKYLGLEGADAMRELVRLLRASGKDLGDLGTVLQQIDQIDPSTPEGQNRLRDLGAEMFRGLAAGSFDLGSLSAAQAQQVMDAALGVVGVSGSGNQTLSSVSTITSMQADRLLGYQQEALRTLREQLAALNRIAGDAVAVSSPSAGSTASMSTYNVDVAANGPLSEQQIQDLLSRIGRELRDRGTYRRAG